MISEEEKSSLLKLARDSIKNYFSDEEIDISKVKKFSKKQGVFVTLNKHNELRGCIGYPEPVLPLYKAIIEAAKSAAFSDPRFKPLQESELDEIEIEISVLSVPELVKVKEPEEYLKKIKIREDGLIIRGTYGSGLLLPQVFVEYKCDVEKALEMLCQKASLPLDAWKNLNNKIYKFQAEIFHE
jgi:uncharacterized protein